MREFARLCWIALIALAAACRGGQESGQARQTASASETSAAEPAAERAGEAAELTAAAEATSEELEQRTAGGAATEEAADVAGVPGRTAPATEGDQPGIKNWLLVEFARPIEAADLEWLGQNGFRVDTVMGENMVRGWLEDPAGGAVIGEDPRIAKIHAQMR